jgi:soluble lytic murein transglycosylase-like protein
MTPQAIGEIVNRIAPQYGLRADIVLCIILQESDGDPFRNRIEESYVELLKPKKREELSGWKPGPKDMPNLKTEKYNRSQSWGLMQVMGETARWCAGVTAPYLTVLLEPERGVDTGCKVLSYYLKKHGTYDRALAAYNAGVPTSTLGQQYSAEVLARLARGEHKRFLSGDQS